MDAKLMALQIKHGTAELAGSSLGWVVHTKDINTGKMINLTDWPWRLPSEAVEDAYRNLRLEDGLGMKKPPEEYAKKRHK